MRARLAACLILPLAIAGSAPPATAGPITLSGGLDVNAANRADALELNTLYDRETSFDGYHLRLAAQGAIAEGFQAFAETRLSDAAEPRVYSAYLVVTPRPERDLHLVAGKMPWIIGTWGEREAAERQPLVGTPLMYQFPTRLPSDAIIPDADSLYRIEGGWGSSEYGGEGGSNGMRIVENGWWDVGAALEGSARPFEFALGVTSGTPGAPNPALDGNSSKSVLGRIGLAPLPGLRLGASGAYGAYLPEELDDDLPSGRTANDYHQRLIMADAELLEGHFELRGEAFTNTWETPTLGSLDAHGGYAEGKYTLAPGLYAAARYDLLRFSHVLESTGESFPWNDDVDRIEAGLGYRPARALVLKAVWQRTALTDEDTTVRHDLVAAQLALSF